MADILTRHYPIPDLNFRDFWDICRHYQTLVPQFRTIRYTVEGLGQILLADEYDLARVRQVIAENGDIAERFTARYYLSPRSEPGDYGNAKLVYVQRPHDFLPAGLHFSSQRANRIQLYHFETYLQNSYTWQTSVQAEVEYGLPCEVLCAVVDMRGFTAFCERPTIESPYICGLLTAFYDMVRKGFTRFPPDLVKFLGDGVLAVWETTAAERELAIESCLSALRSLPSSWRQITDGPEFRHGAPDAIGSAICFGLASKISIDNDYIGRPINLAHRLCSVCPPNKTFVDKGTPGVGGYGVRVVNAQLKSFGDMPVWVLDHPAE